MREGIVGEGDGGKQLVFVADHGDHLLESFRGFLFSTLVLPIVFDGGG